MSTLDFHVKLLITSPSMRPENRSMKVVFWWEKSISVESNIKRGEMSTSTHPLGID